MVPIAPMATATPIPAFAPVDRPETFDPSALELAGELLDAVEEVLEAVEELLDTVGGLLEADDEIEF